MKDSILSPLLDELAIRIVTLLKPELNLIVPAPALIDKDELLTVAEVAELLNVSKVTVHTWKKSGQLKFHRYGTRIRFKKSEILHNEKYSKGKK